MRSAAIDVRRSWSRSEGVELGDGSVIATSIKCFSYGAFARAERAVVRGEVEPLDVLGHHPRGAEARAELGDRLAHERDPALRQALAVPLVEGGDHVLLEHGEERVGVDLVLLRVVQHPERVARADREPVRRRVRPRPTTRRGSSS